MSVEKEKRAAIAIHHSATHLVHAALREILGDHVQQKGSLVDENKLRFDFSHSKPLSSEEILAIETIVNKEALKNLEVKTELMKLDDALKSGAMALFGEKYDDDVRVLTMGENSYSVELCGGTHVERTGDVGFFAITSQSSVASGIRRIEAVAGIKALEYINTVRNATSSIQKILNVSVDDIEEKIKSLLDENKNLKKADKKNKNVVIKSEKHKIEDWSLIIEQVQVSDTKDLRNVVDNHKNTNDRLCVVVFSVDDDRVAIVSGVTKNLSETISAKDVVNIVAGNIGGKGGGRSEFAQGAGETKNIDEFVTSILNSVQSSQHNSTMTKIIVQKFGGTSVGSVERIDAVADIIADASKTAKIVVVVSAMAGETNKLVNLAKNFSENPDKREFDALVSTGETVSSALLSLALHSKGIKAKSYSASQISMKTTDTYSKAKILDVNAEKILQVIKEETIPIITGFQGVTEDGDITTLGRGGSDTTAVAIAAQIGAERCDIYTDVDGIYTTDPKIVPNAKKLDSITMEEMLELAGQGAKVMQTRAVEFANKYNVPVRVLSSFTEGSGTLITLEEESMENALISGIAFQKDQVKFTLHGVGDIPGTAFKILGPISDAEVEVDVIVQNVSVDGKTDFTFTVPYEDQETVIKIIDSIKDEVKFKQMMVDSDIAKVSLVGVGMRSQAGVASRAFKALSENEVNIQIICTSEIKLTMVIDKNLTDKAVKILHEEFDLEN